MKRFFITIFLVAVGAALGGGGFYVASNWEHRFNPFRDKSKDQAQSLLTQLRRACATDAALKGAYVKSADPTDGQLMLRGLVAKKEQADALEKSSKAILEESPELLAKCEHGISTDGLKVLTVSDQLQRLQTEFEAARGNSREREVMRTTRLDAIGSTDDGKLLFRAASIRGSSTPDATKVALLEVLRDQIIAFGVPPDAVPDLALEIKQYANPALAIQKTLAQDPRAAGVRLMSAWYDAKGTLHLEGIAASAEERKVIDAAADAFTKDPQTREIATQVATHIALFDEKSHTAALQKKLVEFARKQNKPHLQHVRLTSVAPALLARDEDDPQYGFQVKGRLLELAGERPRIEIELTSWLTSELPKLRNLDQTPLAPTLDLAAREHPIFAMQARVVQRDLDGVVFIDGLYDEQGRLEVFGRLHQPGNESKETLEATVKDLLVEEGPWTLQTLKAHEASKDAAPLAWSEVVRACRARLASDRTIGGRMRLDRLYFSYVKEQLRLVADGVFLADFPGENVLATLAKSVDAVIVSRGQANVSMAPFKMLRNPLTSLQNLIAERPDLDGVLVAQAHYDPTGHLLLDGYLGRAEQKPALAMLLAERLETTPDLLQKSSDPKAGPMWSIDGMKPHPSAKGEWKWAEVVRACQGELSADAIPQRTCLERAYFSYAEAKTARQLTLHCKTINLLKPGAKLDEPALAQKLAAVSKRLLPELSIDQMTIDAHAAPMPIFALQKLADANRHDGLLFQDAFYDRDGKLVLAGIRGSDEQLKEIPTLIDKSLDKTIAPFGVAGLERIRLIPWQPMLTAARTQFAGDPSSLLKQTRIDRVYFQHNAEKRVVVHVKGICIYEGKTLDADAQTATLAERLQKHLAAQGIEGFTLNIAGIERKSNPASEMQKQAIDAGMDGVVFRTIAFDAKGACYVQLPLIPTGQEASIRKVIDEAARNHTYLGVIQQK